MILFLILIISALIAQLFFPWWIVIPIAFICCYIKAKSAGSAFIISFLAIFALWIVMSLFLSLPNDHLLANRVGQMLKLPESSFSWLLVALISTLPGAITAALSGTSAFFLRKIIRNN